ncbi:PQQ-dependent sugar dehydrogenase [Leucothrix arctica]|uniref:Sugar dehydrogenase n=1 Tax=Leucothrix arctica TaxID=1481894 RepID=A0A317C634_9GAMM|nr:PQQ-dependent sugar dehydrogenase [Leucothrix arctica]PWQ93767.1 sugar dehydrogenase [Leucothrix arctica]
MKYFFSLICLLFPSISTANSYPVSAEFCDGFPQANIGTMEGVCVGVVAQESDTIKWVKPRRIVQVAGTKQFIVTDMGGWKRGKGTVWLLDTADKPATLVALLSDLKLPHGLQVGPNGLFYVGETDRIFRFSLKNRKAVGVETVIENLPDAVNHSHPLSHFIFDHDNNLIVNIGAPSDQCKEDAREVYCSSVNDSLTTHAGLRRYYYISEANLWGRDYEVLATGLRNSMALASHKSGTLLQAENSIDLPGLHNPFEEINEIEEGRFYGWPYCYDNQKINPLWPTHGGKICSDPKQHKQPWIVLPAHAAPLDMRYYDGSMFESLKGSLLLSWHGYRATGHRLVSYKVDPKGLPIRAEKAHYFIDKSESENLGRNVPFLKTPYPSDIKNIAQAHEVISQSNSVPNIRPSGRPAGMTVAEDGSIWVLDDVNKALLRVAKGKAYKEVKDKTPDTSLDKFFAKVSDTNAAKVLLKRCQACHDLSSTVKDMKVPTTWLVKNDGKRLIENRVFHSPMRPMPPNSSLLKEETEAIKEWLTHL